MKIYLLNLTKDGYFNVNSDPAIDSTLAKEMLNCTCFIRHLVGEVEELVEVLAFEEVLKEYKPT